MLIIFVEFLSGLILLIWGADRFVCGASAAARKLGIKPLLIGLTIVAFATSAPEILVSVFAAMRGEPDLAIGNAIGSNIMNIGLVLSLVVLLKPIELKSATVRREMSTLLAVTLLVTALFLDSYLSLIDGYVLLGGLLIIIVWLIRIGLRTTDDDPIKAEFEAEIPHFVSGKRTALQLGFGLLALLAGAEFLVGSAIDIARIMGVSELLVGIILVALGTSLPELAVSLVSVIKGEYGLALGNIVGSNIINSLAVIGTAVVIEPTALPPSVLSVHLFAMIGFTLILFATTFDYGGKKVISRLEGLTLLIAFAVYMVYTVSSGVIQQTTSMALAIPGI
jgi:cation:H+ antiporter